MFDTAAGQVLAAVRRWTSGQESSHSPRNEWPTIRKLCKDVIVCLDSHGQHTLAAREYQQFKATCNTAEDVGDARARHRFLDAAEELHSTLEALSRFQSHLSAAPDSR
jgi:hypothetical protein